MRPVKICEMCGERYQVEPNLKFRSRYCRTCRMVAKRRDRDTGRNRVEAYYRQAVRNMAVCKNVAEEQTLL
jgi:hypothetical protein